ncbi:MAG: flagellin [Phycisphaerales bacterium]|nr:flagellin [Phycisphaerales bacterium]
MIGKTPDSLGTLQTQRFLRLNHLRHRQALQRLATGHRIHSAADDPAGLIAAQRLSASLAALEAEARSVERTRAIAATADAALAETSSLLVEARRLAVANSDSSLSDAERAANQAQIDSIVASVDRIANTTQFNGRKLLDGSLTLTVTGASQPVPSAGSGAIGRRQIEGTTFTLAAIRTGGELASNRNRGQDTVAVIDQAIADVASSRARIGAFTRNVLDTRANSLSVAIENLSAAESVIRDSDFALESAARVRSELLSSAGIRALRWSFARQRRVLSLLA